jgi:hypothetical protein
MNAEQLFDLFVEHSITAQEIAAMNLTDIERGVHELRQAQPQPDNLPLSDAEIARAIYTYATDNI